MWQRTDAWILQACVYAAGWRGQDLSDVIAAADAINVDIPNRETIENAVNRLAAAGLLSAEGQRVRPTRAGRRLVGRLGHRRQGIRELSRLIEADLRTVPFPHQTGGWTLNEADWSAAY